MNSERLSGALIDRATQRWVIATGRPILFDAHPWLDGPVGSPDGIADDWIGQHAARVSAVTTEDSTGGLLTDFGRFDGPGFAAERLDPQVRDFYEATAGWQLDVWSRWSPWAEPGGRLINAVFARRLRQLALPTDPLETAYGMDSRVITFTGPDGEHIGTAWQRTMRASGATVFGGFYGIADLPRARRPSVRVVFPLPNGNLTIFLRPDVSDDGALRLTSPRGSFGENGAYLVVRPAGRDHGWARRVPLPEQFEIFVDPAGELRCDHRAQLFRAEFIRLHYRLRPVP